MIETFTPPHYQEHTTTQYAKHPNVATKNKFSTGAQYRFNRLSPLEQSRGMAYAARKGKLGNGSVLKTHSVLINTGTDNKVFRFSPDHPHVSIADQLGQQLEAALGSDTRIDLVSNKHQKPLHEIAPAKIMTEVDWANVSMRFRPDQMKRNPNLGKIHMTDSRDVAQAEFESYVDTLCDAASEHIAGHITKEGTDKWEERADKIGCRQKLTHHMARVLKAHGKRCHPKVGYNQYLMTHGVLYPSQFVDYLSYRMSHAVDDVRTYYQPSAKTNCNKLKAVIKHKLKKALFCNKIFRWMARRWECCFRFIRCINGYRDCRVDKYGRRKASKEIDVAKWHGYKSGGSSSSSSSGSSSGSDSDSSSSLSVDKKIDGELIGSRDKDKKKSERKDKKKAKKDEKKAKKSERMSEEIRSGITDDYGRVRPELVATNILREPENDAGIPYSSDEEDAIGVYIDEKEEEEDANNVDIDEKKEEDANNVDNDESPEYSDDESILTHQNKEKKNPKIVGAYLEEEEEEEEDPEIVGAYLEEEEEDPEIVDAYLEEEEEDPEIVGAYLPDSKKNSIANMSVQTHLGAAQKITSCCSNKKNGPIAKAPAPKAASSVASSAPSDVPNPVTSVANPVDMFHKLWNSEKNKPLIRQWIGSDTENTYVMWPDKLNENLDTPQKVQAFLQRQSFKAPMRVPLRNQTFRSIDGSKTYTFDAEEKKVNGMLSSRHEIAGGDATTLADFPLNKGRIFVRPYQTI